MHMVMRIVAFLSVLSAAAAAQADLINTDFSSSFETGWTSSSTVQNAGSWSIRENDQLFGRYGHLEVVAPNTIISMSQSFTLDNFDPSRVDSANLSWQQYLSNRNDTGEPDFDPIPWSETQRFRVILADSSGGTADDLIAFTTTPASPQSTAQPESRSANQGDLLAFLRQLTIGEQLTLIYEATTDGLMFAAIDNISMSFTLAPTPEPGSLVLCGLGFGAMLIRKRMRRRSSTTSA